jgi:hypothetical protein
VFTEQLKGTMLAQMSPLFGLNGLADVAYAMALGLFCFGVFLVGIVTLIALALKSRTASIIAMVLAFVLTLLLTPWRAFVSVDSRDEEVHGWVSMFRWVAVLWIVVSVGAVASAVRAFRADFKGGLVGWLQVALFGLGLGGVALIVVIIRGC